MIKINLKTKISVVQIRTEPCFGRYVANNLDFVRRRIFVHSLNSTLAYLEKNIPTISLRQDPIFFETLQLKDSVKKRFQAVGGLRPEDLRLDFFRAGLLHKGIDELLLHLNKTFLKAKINGKYFEFILKGSGELPRSTICILLRDNPIDLNAEEKLKKALPDIFDFETHSKLIMDAVKKPLYSEEEVYNLLSNNFGGISRHFVSILLTYQLNDVFGEVLRPQAREHRRLFFIKPIIRNLVEILSYYSYGPRYALQEDINQLLAEKRIIPVLKGDNEIEYFTPNLLAKCLESGEVITGIYRGKMHYILSRKIGDGINPVHLYVPKSVSLSNPVFLRFFRNGELTEEIKCSYPLFAAAVKLLRASPHRTEPAFESARIAAENGASWEQLTAILLHKCFSEKIRLSKYAKRFLDYLHVLGYGRDIPFLSWQFNMITKDIFARIWLVNKALRFNINAEYIKDVRALVNQIKSFLNIIGEEGKTSVHLEFFSLVLGRLIHTQPGGLNEKEEMNLRLLVAPLAEKFGLLTMTKEIRNQAFRIFRNHDYEIVRRKIKEALGLTSGEAEIHLQDTADLIREVLRAGGVPEESYEIVARIKSPYSVWEKMKAKGIGNPRKLYDLLGISIVTKSDALAYCVADLVKQALPDLSLQQRALFAGRKNNLIFYQDNIAKPRRDGFSAIKMVRTTLLKLPVEIQVTSLERDLRNKKKEAAHWRYKFCREIGHFFPGLKKVEVSDIFNLGL